MIDSTDSLTVQDTKQVTGTKVQSTSVMSDPQSPLWYCPSRWLLAHQDLKSNIHTMSSHMCLADLNNDGENLMALIDFKHRRPSSKIDDEPPIKMSIHKPPYDCRMRVYRGLQLIYNHFLDDIPSCLIATSISLPTFVQSKDKIHRTTGNKTTNLYNNQTDRLPQQPLFTLAINDDVYFYHKLKPSHKLSLEDEQCIMDSLVKSETDAWAMVRNNKVDIETMSELLESLSQELGPQELTSHSNNFLSLSSSEAKKEYLIAWKLKRLQQSNNLGEQIMSMDTICCSAARLKYNSSITRSGDYGQTREKGDFLNNARWNRILDIQKDGLVLGTEDRHLLLYELRTIRTRLECHYRLRSVPDHILVERKSPENFEIKQELDKLTYKILISCRNCRIYYIDQLYLVKEKSSPSEVKELVALKSNVLDMCWTGMDEHRYGATDIPTRTKLTSGDGPTFITACLDRKVYCFSSQTGQCKWIVELELPISSLICLPKIQISSDEASLIGVATQANRIDFFVASDGRIVDSIYFSQDDYPQAMIFGRFGREDNCLCLVTNAGHLIVLILKKTAKFAHGQCLSSAASYASSTLATYGQILKQSQLNVCNHDLQDQIDQNSNSLVEENLKSQLNLIDSPNLPSAFTLSKHNSTNMADQIFHSMFQSDHSCNQVTAKNKLSVLTSQPRLHIPVKRRDFVELILDQSKQSRQMSQLFVSHMIKLKDGIKSAYNQQANSGIDSCNDEGNRLILTKIVGLGNVYSVKMAFRLNLGKFIDGYEQILREGEGEGEDNGERGGKSTSSWSCSCYLRQKEETNQTRCIVRPFRFSLPLEKDSNAKHGIKSICDTTISFKLIVVSKNSEPRDGECINVTAQVHARYQQGAINTVIQRPLFVGSINVPLVFS